MSTILENFSRICFIWSNASFVESFVVRLVRRAGARMHVVGGVNNDSRQFMPERFLSLAQEVSDRSRRLRAHVFKLRPNLEPDRHA